MTLVLDSPASISEDSEPEAAEQTEPLDEYHYLSFRLNDSFIEKYKDRKVSWGFDIGGGNSLSELTYITKYSRKRADGTKERWYECCRRCVEGYYSILKDWCLERRTPWNEAKAQRAAEDAYDRMFSFKWTPPGRGMQMMGTPFVNEGKNSAPLQNCSVLSTAGISTRSVKEATAPFCRLFEESMLGIGVAFDTRGANKLTIHEPTGETKVFVIPDSREGWVESLHLLMASYLFTNQPTVIFDYSLIRPAGSLIKTFGGTAAGPDPLRVMHERIRNLFKGRAGELMTDTDIVEIMNMIGKAVVSGGVRRTAELAAGEINSEGFLDLKDWSKNPERMGKDGWGHTSNNSVFAEVGSDYDAVIDRIANNGEPGLIYLDLARNYGRLLDPPNGKDSRVVCCNPCAEIFLEHTEKCTLVECYPTNHESLEDFKKTLKHAYLYGKAVTLLPTHWTDTNEVMQRNRRIGCGVTGVFQFAEEHGWTTLRTWLNEGYDTVTKYDTTYSEWLGVRESVKKTTVKPSGTSALIAGVTPGAHAPTGRIYIRRQRFVNHDPLVPLFVKAGYHVEPDFMDPDNSVVVEFPTLGPDVRTEKEVSVWEKGALAVLLQRYWADNSVSITLTFSKDEREQIGALLRAYEGQLKTVSFLPMGDDAKYEQMPYEEIPREQYDQMTSKVKPINWDKIYDGGQALDAEGDRFCTNDVCEIPQR